MFQCTIDTTFGDIQNVMGIADDIIIVGYQEDGSDHDKALIAVLQWARAKGPKMNPDKLIIRVREIPFYGYIIGHNGLRPDPGKVEAIGQMPPPQDAKQLQSFLGLVNYLSMF